MILPLLCLPELITIKHHFSPKYIKNKRFPICLTKTVTLTTSHGGQNYKNLNAKKDLTLSDDTFT